MLSSCFTNNQTHFINRINIVFINLHKKNHTCPSKDGSNFHLGALYFGLSHESNAISSDEEVNQSLVQFMDKLSGSSQRNSNWCWNMSSDPCTDKWLGVTCYLEVQSV